MQSIASGAACVGGWSRSPALDDHSPCCSGTSGPVLLLIHGFGASAYHWRYNIPQLAKTHRVYALCMLGFGYSDKPVTEYYGSDG